MLIKKFHSTSITNLVGMCFNVITSSSVMDSLQISLTHSFHRILSRGGRTQHDTFIAQTVRFSSKENKQLPGCPRVFSFYVSNSLATIRKAQFPVEKRTKKPSEVNNSTVKSNYLSVLSLNLLSPVETNICAVYRNV